MMTMLYFDLDIELTEDCVFSERRATFGMPGSLEYVPGAKLLGAAAATLYCSLGDTAFDVFHAGCVSFGNGLPVSDADEIGYPMPFCWHVRKHEDEAILEHPGRWRLDSDQILNGKFGLNPRDRQLREGFVTASGEWLRPRRRHAPKTAHEPGKNKAAEGRLFGYDAVLAEQRFRSRIAIAGAGAAERAILGQLQATLNTTLRLGRSRSAEFGSARCLPGEVRELPPAAVSGTELNLWLVSDLAARDPYGAPTVSPDPAWLKLPPGQLLLQKSFIRSRRYSPFNSYWQTPEEERQVIERGSVLCYKLERAPDAGQCARLAFGLGEHRASGLGQVLCNPSLLQHESPTFDAWKVAVCGAAGGPEAKRGLAAWLHRAASKQANAEIEAWVSTALGDWRGSEKWRDAAGPGASQWSSIAEIAARCGEAVGALRAALFDAPGAPCRAGDEAWGRRFDAAHTYAAWLREKLEELVKRAELPPGRAIAALALAIRNELAGQRR